MATITEDYCSQEVYRLLEKKGLMEKFIQPMIKRDIHKHLSRFKWQ